MRTIHPMAWWAWALGCAVAVSLVTNPLLVVLLVLVAWWVVLSRRTRAPWARAAGAYLTLALFVIGFRLVFQVVMGVNRTGQVLFTLPEVRLPSWAAGVRIGGPVTLDGLLFTLYDSLRLAAMLMCVGAANALANPRRALKAVPPALQQVSVAVVVALTVAPQLIESVQRVRRARRLRGGASRGWRAVTAVVVPVLEDAIERSLQLAAGMETRGYGRTHAQRAPGLLVTGSLLASMSLVTFGIFLLLGIPGSQPWSSIALILGGGLGALGFRLSGARVAVSRYRPDVWGWPEWALSIAGVAVVAVVIGLGRMLPEVMTSPVSPPGWPELHPAMLAVLALVAIPMVVTRPPSKEAL